MYKSEMKIGVMSVLRLSIVIFVFRGGSILRLPPEGPGARDPGPRGRGQATKEVMRLRFSNLSHSGKKRNTSADLSGLVCLSTLSFAQLTL